MRSFRVLAAALFAAVAFSCTDRASVSFRIDGVGEDVPVVVKRYEAKGYTVLDTMRTDTEGAFRWSCKVVGDEPAFVYFFRNNDRIAALLLESGDKADVLCDTLGSYMVSGSEQSGLLAIEENDYEQFLVSVAEDDNEDLVSKYVAYYRKCVEFVIGHPFTLANIPVLFRKIGDFPVFSSDTDACIFRSACDSLKKRYPNSAFVEVLEKETERREKLLNLSTIMRSASEVGFPDISLPSMNGEKIALSSVDAPVVVVCFWGADDNLFNLETILPIYRKYSGRGLEVYSVCTNPDKLEWASMVNGQNFPWINLNDGLGDASPALTLFNVKKIPGCAVIADGNLVANGIETAAELESEIRKVSSCLQ